MTYPGLILLVGVGVGIATFLYYMFAENEHRNEQRQYSSRPHDDTLSNLHNDWTIPSHRSEKARLNRRNTSNSSMKKIKERKDSVTIKEDINCSICQYALIEMDVIQLRPCRHNFHKDCINNLKIHNPTAPCPNCRTTIKHAI